MKAEREKWSGRVTAKALRFQTGQYELAEEEEICRIILVSGGSFTLVRGGESLLVNPGCVLLLGPGGGLLQQAPAGAQQQHTARVHQQALAAPHQRKAAAGHQNDPADLLLLSQLILAGLEPQRLCRYPAAPFFPFRFHPHTPFNRFFFSVYHACHLRATPYSNTLYMVKCKTCPPPVGNP